MRAIDGDKLWGEMYRYSDNEGAKMPYGDDDSLIHKDSACFLIENAPTIEPERKTGKWINNSPVTMKCDQCGLVIKDWDWHRFKFCPNCGADMRGEQE